MFVISECCSLFFVFLFWLKFLYASTCLTLVFYDMTVWIELRVCLIFVRWLCSMTVFGQSELWCHFRGIRQSTIKQCASICRKCAVQLCGISNRKKNKRLMPRVMSKDNEHVNVIRPKHSNERWGCFRYQASNMASMDSQTINYTDEAIVRWSVYGLTFCPKEKQQQQKPKLLLSTQT